LPALWDFWLQRFTTDDLVTQREVALRDSRATEKGNVMGVKQKYEDSFITLQITDSWRRGEAENELNFFILDLKSNKLLI
jgi:hypothetical protein